MGESGGKSLISVIIPAYNAERTLERTVRSVMASAIPLDVLIVDDGSTDGTRELADRLLQENADSLRGVEDSLPYQNQTCLHVIHQPNSGCYQARVNALKQIKTPYFGFVDADDTVDPDMYERMLAFAQEYDLDIVECDVVGGIRNDGVDEFFTSRDEIAQKVIRPVIAEGCGCMFVWNKLYRRRNVKLEPSPIFMFEDMALNLQLFDGVGKFGRLHEGLYHYDVNPGSSVKNFRRKNVDDLKEVIRFRKEYLPRYGIANDDPAHERWLRKNVRNMYITAASACCSDWSTRVSNVRYLFDVAGYGRPACLQLRILVLLIVKRAQVLVKRICKQENWK